MKKLGLIFLGFILLISCNMFKEKKEIILIDKSGSVVDLWTEVYDYEVVDDTVLYLDLGTGLDTRIELEPGTKMEVI